MFTLPLPLPLTPTPTPSQARKHQQNQIQQYEAEISLLAEKAEQMEDEIGDEIQAPAALAHPTP